VTASVMGRRHRRSGALSDRCSAVPRFQVMESALDLLANVDDPVVGNLAATHGDQADRPRHCPVRHQGTLGAIRCPTRCSLDQAARTRPRVDSGLVPRLGGREHGDDGHGRREDHTYLLSICSARNFLFSASLQKRTRVDVPDVRKNTRPLLRAGIHIDLGPEDRQPLQVDLVDHLEHCSLEHYSLEAGGA